MSNILDDLFSAQVPWVRYAFTFIDPAVPSNQPMVSLATGFLLYEHRLEIEYSNQEIFTPFGKRYRGYIRDAQQYIDRNFDLLHVQDSRLGPSLVRGTNPLQFLLKRTPPGYYFEYNLKINPALNYRFYPEISTGGNFPGYPYLRSAVLIGKTWLGAATLVLDIDAATRV